MTQPPTSPAPEAPDLAADENHVMAERRTKLAKLREAGPAFPNDFVPAHRAAELLAAHAGADRDALAAAHVAVSVAGRMVLKRVQGKASFATLQDATGRLQLWINDEGVGADAHEAFKHWDLGDIVAAEGTLFR
ncbi:MAG: OB-fold nucleic acid binding domain-containing protein, partial [Burkholderiales bacterium]